MVSQYLSIAAFFATALALPSGLHARASQTALAGVNIAGFDFGCDTTGTCNVTNAYPPLASLGGPDGIGQMQHFVKDRGLDLFRLPVGWQYLTNGNSEPTKIDANQLSKYDQLVQGCVNTGAKCIIDIHNYARYNNAIIGQGGPTNAQFASFWSQLATKYKCQSSVIFGIMNEPHDLTVSTWGTTVQAAVTAIRQATGNDDNIILLPGTQYTSAEYFVSDGSYAALSGIKNPDGTTKNLIFDVHQYLDSDGSGSHTTCVTTGVSNLNPLQSQLAKDGRQALLSETGGGSSDSSCEIDVCTEIAYLNQNSGQFLGYAGWSAGSFDSSYLLSLTPTKNGSTWTDVPLLTKCLARK